MTKDAILIDRLVCRAVVGIEPSERHAKQDVVISARIFVDARGAGRYDQVDDTLNYGEISRQVVAHVEDSERFTVEALATDVAGICLASGGGKRVRVKVMKPGANTYARSLGVVIDRTPSDLARSAYIAMGSNLDAHRNLRNGLEGLSTVGIPLSTSSVYQTRSIGDSSQPDYLNAVCMVQTCLPATEIRRRLKAIEKSVGREKGCRPIPLDLDLCMLDDERLVARDFTLPHPEILERYYLAIALAEIDPGLKHPTSRTSFASIASGLRGQEGDVKRTTFVLSTES